MPQGRLQPYYITVDDASGVVSWRVEFRSNFYTSLDVQAFVSFFVFWLFWFWRWRWRWWLWWLEVKRNRATLTSFLSLCRTFQSLDNAALRFSGGFFKSFWFCGEMREGAGIQTKSSLPSSPSFSFVFLFTLAAPRNPSAIPQLEPGTKQSQSKSGGVACFLFSRRERRRKEKEEEMIFPTLSQTHSLLLLLLPSLSLSLSLSTSGHAVGQGPPFVFYGVRMPR